jgi:hypothetical protein
MKKSIKAQPKKRRGRPATGKDPMVGFRARSRDGQERSQTSPHCQPQSAGWWSLFWGSEGVMDDDDDLEDIIRRLVDR